MKSRCFRGHVSGCSKQDVLKFWNTFLFPWTPLGRRRAGWLTVGRDVTVALSTKTLRNCFHIQKDASWAGDSPGISLETNGHLLVHLIDNSCYTIILVPGSGQSLFHVRMLVPPYTNIQISFNCFLVRPYLKILRHALVLSQYARVPHACRPSLLQSNWLWTHLP